MDSQNQAAIGPLRATQGGYSTPSAAKVSPPRRISSAREASNSVILRALATGPAPDISPVNLSLGNLDLPSTPPWVLSVDGMTPQGPNLSHWPGNRTPPEFKADLSTGICLRFAQAPLDRRLQFLDGASLVVNDHYDTDGFLSLLTVLQPEVAIERQDILLEAAATGDFQSFQTRRGFAIDRIVLNLAGERSPIRDEFTAASGPGKDFARYRWLLEHAVEILDHPEQFAALYQEELDLIEHQLQDPDIRCRNLAHCGLALISSPGPVHRLVLNTLA